MNFNRRWLGALGVALTLGATVMTAAEAYDRDDYRQDRRDYRRHVNRQIRRANRARVYDWNTERGMYRSNWNRLSNAQRMQYDAQMRAQWLAYKNNNYNGAYTWNNYNDPAFLDYVHNRNPGLLTNLRNALGF